VRDPAAALLRAHQLGTIIPRIEWTYRARVVTTALTVSTQVFVYVVLWQALYADGGAVAGLTELQAMSYSILAALLTSSRVLASGMARESAQSRIRDGSIVYWFTRPIPAARYARWRGVGESAHTTGWLIAGGGLAAAFGVLAGPASAEALAVTLVSFVAGQVIFYQLGIIVELSSFWTITTHGISRLFVFAQALLSGAVIPLWFFPGWLQTASLWSPFAAAVNTPVSIYIGRMEALPWGPLAAQVLWCVVLGGVVRAMWRAVRGREHVFGG